MLTTGYGIAAVAAMGLSFADVPSLVVLLGFWLGGAVLAVLLPLALLRGWAGPTRPAVVKVVASR
ncbi:MAG: hypothetical protein AAGF57_03360 [Pseudomonadota bacterium]